MRVKTITKIFCFLALFFAVFVLVYFESTKIEAQNKSDSEENQRDPVFPPSLLKIPKGSIKNNSVLPSNLLTELEKRKTENTKISDGELAEIGTRLIKEIGFDYDIDLSTLAEKSQKSGRRKQLIESTDGMKYLAVSQTLTLTNGAKKLFELFPPAESSCCCGYYYTTFPVSRINDKTLTLMVQGKPFEIRRTKDLSVSQEHILYADKKLKRVVRRWQVPSETLPYGISRDGTKLYIDLDFSNLLLEISERGDLKIVTKNADNIISDGVDLNRQEAPQPGEILYKSGENGLMQFKSGGKSYFIDFPYVCT